MLEILQFAGLVGGIAFGLAGVAVTVIQGLNKNGHPGLAKAVPGNVASGRRWVFAAGAITASSLLLAGAVKLSEIAITRQQKVIVRREAEARTLITLEMVEQRTKQLLGTFAQLCTPQYDATKFVSIMSQCVAELDGLSGVYLSRAEDLSGAPYVTLVTLLTNVCWGEHTFALRGGFNIFVVKPSVDGPTHLKSHADDFHGQLVTLLNTTRVAASGVRSGAARCE